ncbi:MAG: hypothetical protein ACI3XN_08415 [Eubacteriales bacterium]
MWEFNPYDSDSNPHLSIPHGDDYSPTHHTLKRNVDNGYIYTARNRRYVGKVDKKELERLHKDEGFQKAKKQALKFRISKEPPPMVKAFVHPFRFELMVEVRYNNRGKNYGR